MSKSTPISQLPNASFDASNMQDIIEDDATVQEVLSQISQSMSASPPPNLIEAQQQQQHQQVPVYNPSINQAQQAQQMHQFQLQQNTQSVQNPVSTMSSGIQMQQPFNGQMSSSQGPTPFYYPFPTQQASPQPADFLATTNNGSFTQQLSAELRTILLVVIVSMFSQILPVQNIITLYSPLANFPYAAIVVRSLLAGCLFFLIRKYIA